MSALIRFIAVLLFLPTVAFGAVLHGTVRESDGTPVAAAVVSSGGASAVTDASGAFTITVDRDPAVARVTHPAHASREVTLSDHVAITLAPAFAETMEVSGIRAEEPTPVTKTNITRAEIAEAYHGQDIPLLMRNAPAVNAYAESGFGASGYSYITLRGVSPSRINFTLDGVPLSDSEDMGTYFVDFGDLARSLESIQIQRGVGTSTVGAPSFGGSVNLQSIDVSSERSTQAELTFGSFGTHAATVALQSGDIGAGIAAYGRLSVLETDGFRDNSAQKQRNFFFSAVNRSDAAQWKLTGFTAREEQQLSFYAADEDTLRSDPRNNPLRPEEDDAFNYDLAQLQYLRPVGNGGDLAASVYYQRGYGAYRMYDDSAAQENLRAYGLDGLLFGSMVTWSRTVGALTTNAGVHVNRFEREHTADLVGGLRDYSNHGIKQEANAFSKFSYAVGDWNLFTDLQLRRASFRYEGSVDIAPISWTFFNPRAGMRRKLPGGSAYLSVGSSSREPARGDMFLGEDNPSVAYDLHEVKPERLVNVEAGWDYATPSLAVAANVYAMEFRNEIAATGELTELGMAIRRNAEKSYRRGIEADVTWQPTSLVRLRTDANLSRNRISKWTQFFDVYDAEGNWVDSRPMTYRNVAPVMSPSYIVNQSIDIAPRGDMSGGLTGRWVGRANLDNTGSNRFSVPSLFTLEAHASISVERWIHAGAPRLTLQVNNVLNDRTLYASGYAYQYIASAPGAHDEFAGTNYYFPQATRHAIARIEFRF